MRPKKEKQSTNAAKFHCVHIAWCSIIGRGCKGCSKAIKAIPETDVSVLPESGIAWKPKEDNKQREKTQQSTCALALGLGSTGIGPWQQWHVPWLCMLLQKQKSDNQQEKTTTINLALASLAHSIKWHCCTFGKWCFGASRKWVAP